MKKTITSIAMSLALSSTLFAQVDCDQTYKVQSFAQRFYVEVLDRQADNAGLDDWTNKLTSGQSTGADVATGFVFSEEFTQRPEFQDSTLFLKVLYRAFFNREADEGGLNGWLEQLASGTSKEDVLNGFLYSQEFANLAAEYGIKAYDGATFTTPALTNFVKRFYSVVLGRDADAAGLADWTNRLSTGVATGEDIAFGFVFSAEFDEPSKDNATFVNTLYSAFFDRAADEGGFNGWMTELANGMSRDELLSNFLHSQEFINLTNSYGIQAYVGAPTVDNSNNVAPVANIVSAKSIAFGESITLDGTESSDSDGAIVCHWWTEKDILLSKKLKFVKNNFKVGEHSVSLTVVDTQGKSSSSSVQIDTKGTALYTGKVSDISVMETEAIVKVVGNIGSDGNISFSQNAKLENWQEGDVKSLSISDAFPDGGYIKVVAIHTDGNTGAKTVEYVTPTLDQVFETLDIKMDTKLTKTKFASIHLNKNVVGTLNGKLFKGDLDTKTLNKWFPEEANILASFNGNSDSFVDGLTLKFNIPIYKDDTEEQHISDAKIDLSGEFSISHFKVTDFEIKQRLNNFIEYFLGLENRLIYYPEVVYRLGVEYDSYKKLHLDMTGEYGASLAKYAKDTMLECGFKSEGSNDLFDYKLKSTGFKKTDICLGYASLDTTTGLGGGVGTNGAVASLSIYFIIGLEMKVKAMVSIDVEKTSFETFGGHLDTNQFKTDVSNVLNGYSTETVKKGSTQKAKWISKVSAEVSGEFRKEMGLVLAPKIRNITPFGLRAAAGVSLAAQGEVYASSALGFGGCWDVDVNALYGVSLITKNGFDLKIKQPFIKKYILDGAKVGFNYVWESKFDPLQIVRYNSCESKEYTAAFINTPTNVEDFTLTHIQVKHIDGRAASFESVQYVVYDEYGMQIRSSTNIFEALNNLSIGNYTVKTIIIIDSQKAIKQSISVPYVVANFNFVPIANAGANFSVAFGEVIVLDASLSTDANPSDVLSYIWRDAEGNVIGYTMIESVPQSLLPGSYAFYLTVDDGHGLSDEDNVTVTVTTASSVTTLKKTGQTTSYADYDDGYYKKGVTPNYSRANEVVTDHITGLEWQDDVEAKTISKNWTDAQSYCSTLSLDGGGWRLPTIQELQSIVVDGAYSPSIDTTAFVNYTTSYNYWSSTTRANYTSYAWIVFFNRGYTDSNYESNANNVRCVR